MTNPPRAPQPLAKQPGLLRQAKPYLALYLILAAAPILLWCTAGNPVTATTAYVNLDQAELLWNTLRTNPVAAAPAFTLAIIDLGWIAWAPFALAAVLHLLTTAFHIPRTAIPRMLLRLSPTAVVSVMVTGTAAAAQTPAGPVHASTLEHHHLGYEHRHGADGARSQSTLEAQVRKAIPHPQHECHAWPTGTHTVAPGDSLWVIAQHTYGRGQDWPEIYDANQGQIQHGGEALTNPALIKPGWTLTLPHDGATTPPPHAARTDPAPPDAATTGTPAINAATSATSGRVAPENTAPATTAPRPVPSAANRPIPPLTATSAHPATHHRPYPAPGPRADAPWTTGLELPDGGYIGITLLMATTGAITALRRRTHRTGQNPDVPASARQLTVIATRAEMAATGAWDPELETDPTPPPLLRPRPEYLIFGTTSTGTDEAILDPQRHPLTIYTGPGAHEAAAALALSALASAPPHRLVITETLAHQLLCIDTDSRKTDEHETDCLTLAPDTAAALTTAAGHAENPDAPRTLVIADAKTANTFQISAALAADKRNRLAVLLLGDPAHLAAHTPTTIDIDLDGWPQKTTGPRAAAFAGTRFHAVPQATAADLYRILRHDRTSQTTLRIPAQTRDEHQATPADEQPEHGPADDEDHRGLAHAALDAPRPSPQQVPQSAPTTTTSTAAVISSTPRVAAVPAAPLLLRVLGALTFENADGQTKPGPRGRNAQLLTYLAIHPRGRTLQQITAAIWSTDKPGGANRTLVRVRQELQAAITELAPAYIPEAGKDFGVIIRERHGTYHLNHQLFSTDYAGFALLEAEARRETDPARRTAIAARAFTKVLGELAEGVSDLDQVWLAAERADMHERATTLGNMSVAVDCTDREMHRSTRAAFGGEKTANA